MPKKSKTQRAKASAARQQRKAARAQEEEAANIAEARAEDDKAEAKKSTAVKKASKEEPQAVSTSSTDIKKKSEEKKPKKKHFQFFRDVRSELHRVTWPTRTDVLRWTGVVVVALLFFGIFVAVLDNLVVTPILYLISGIGG